MTATRSFYRAEPVITFRGGTSFLFRIVIDEVRSTTLDGKITDVIRIGPLNLVGWTNFLGTLGSFDGTIGLPATVALEGLGDEGAVLVGADPRTTWALQQAGLRAGRLTVCATPPGGGRYEIIPLRWNLKPGSTSPLSGA